MIASRAAEAPAPVAGARLPLRQLVWLNAYWFANNLHWGALLAIVIPSQVEKLFGHKDLNYPLVVVGGTAAAVIIHPLVGALSDRTTARLGRRRPWLLWATLPNVAGLGLLAVAPSVGFMALAYLIVQTANNAANAPWSAIIADLVPRAQRGAASGLNGLMSVLGTVAGALLAGLLLDKTRPLAVYRGQLLAVYGLIAAVQVVVVLATVYLVHERPAGHDVPPLTRRELRRVYWVDPRASPDFFWVCLTRLLIQFGIFAIFYYLQYYIEDVLGLPGERTVGTVFLPVTMLAAAVTVYAAGALSDRVSRKRLVYLSGAFMIVACIMAIFWRQAAAVPAIALVFGVGNGAYTSVDWALACDVLPDTQAYGRDMGIWAMMGILPQLLGIVLGGVSLAAFQGLPNHAGYTILFGLTLLCFILGTVLIRRVRGVA